MRIRVILKNPSNITKAVSPLDCELAHTPHTFGELIDEAVRSSVAAYRSRNTRGEEFIPLSDEQMAGMREVGRFVWTLPVEAKEVDLNRAICTAREAVSDGLVRVFHDTRELTDPDTPIEIAEGDTFTFVRLTLLTGRLW